MKKLSDNKVIQLFLSFLKIGTFTFGGGYAMIPLIQREVVDNKQWLSEGDIADVIAIAETTPGPIAINAATFVGYKTKGFKGALAATLGVIIPSFVIIVAIALLFEKYMKYDIVANAFWGIRVAVLGLMIKACISMYKQCPKNVVSYAVAGIALICVGIININALIIIISAAFVGVVYGQIKRGKTNDIS